MAVFPGTPYCTSVAYEGEVTGTTWDSVNKNANVTLSNGNLTATSNAVGLNADYPGFATASVGTNQKMYWEVTVVAVSGTADTGVGIATIAHSLSIYIGGDVNSLCFFATGQVIVNAVVQATIQTISAGDVVGVAYDAANNKIWFRNNGGNWNNDVIGNQNPATNTGGIAITLSAAFPAYNCSYDGTTQNQFTANFAGAFANPAPSGFSHL